MMMAICLFRFMSKEELRAAERFHRGYHREQDAVTDAVVLLDVLLQTTDREDDGVAEVIIVFPGEVFDHDALHVGEERLDLVFSILRRGQGETLLGIDIRIRGEAAAELEAVGEPLPIVLANTSEERLFERLEEAANQGQRRIASTHREEGTEMPLDVGELVTLVIAIRFRQVVDDLREVERAELPFREVLLVQKGVEDSQEEVCIQLVLGTDVSYGAVAQSEADA